MVILNDVVPIDYNKMKRLLWKKLDWKIISILNNTFYNYNEKDKNKYINYIYNNIKNDYNQIVDSNYFVDKSMNKNYCVHIYKRGKREGQICGNKIFIESNDKMQQFLCSRHCRDYSSKPRNYSHEKPRCNHVRINGNQCKHNSLKYSKYCYIHNQNYILNKVNHEVDDKIKKLKYLRMLYYKNRKKNRKNKIKQIIYSFKKKSYGDIKYDLKYNYINNNNVFHNFPIIYYDIT